MSAAIEAGSTGEDVTSGALEELRAQVGELQRALQEIGGSGVDALVVADPDDDTRPHVYTLAATDRPYRLILERMGEGAMTVSEGGVVLYANPRVGAILGHRAEEMVGRDLIDFVPVEELPALTRLVGDTREETRREELSLPREDGTTVPYLATATQVEADGVVLRCLVFTDLSMQRQLEDQKAERAARAERQQVAIEVNDTIVQGLVAAEMALDLGQHDFARSVVARTADHARQWIGRLVTDVGASALRSGPAQPGREHP